MSLPPSPYAPKGAAPVIPAAVLQGLLAFALLAPAAACVGGRSGALTAAPVAAKEAEAKACAATALPPSRVWRLTHAQLRNTLIEVFGYVGPGLDQLPADARLDGFANGAHRLGVPPLLLDYYRKVSDEISADVLRRSAEVLPCPVDRQSGDVDGVRAARCLREAVSKLGMRAWRRPLTDEEAVRLEKLHATAAAHAGPELGLKMLIEALILSPNFLFRHELGDSTAIGSISRLTDWEIASALSYTLWDGPPDAALMSLAAAGRLRDPVTLESEARRLLASQKRAPAALTNFFRQWLRIEDLPTLGKDSIQFPIYTPELARDLMEENRRFLSSVLFDQGGDRSLRTLLTADYSFVNGKMGRLYAVTTRGGELKRMSLPREQRRGIFTQAAFLAARADADVTRPVDRGAFVREEILCAEVPPPPDEFKFDESKINDEMTAREKLAAHARSGFCSRCHALFDGIGFALESYDAIGQYRTTDKGKRLDTSGTLPLPDEPPIQFANFVELVDKLAERRRPYDCFAGRYLAYASGRRLEDLALCERQAIAERFARNNYRIDELILDVVRSPSFVARANLAETTKTTEEETAAHGN